MKSDFTLEYNSGRDKLIIPEYGRNIQKLIQHAKEIENDDERQQFIERVVGLMMQMHPQNRNLDDYRSKLWRHVFMIADFDINVTPPNGKIPDPEDMVRRPDKVEYPDYEAKFRHYGSNVQRLIKKAISMEPGSKKDGFVAVIGSYMKLAYRTWNKEHYVSDDIIKSDLEALSEGKLVLDENIALDTLTQHNRRKKRHNNGRDKDHSHKGRSHKGRKRK